MADRIAQILSASGGSEGRVFAIRGAWGFGKSSLKNLVIEAIAARHPGVQVLDFNPWQWGDNDSIARALFTQMAGKLGGAHSREASKRAKALRHYGGLLTGGGTQLRAASKNGAGIATLVTTGAGLAALLGLTWPGIEARTVGWAFLAASAAAWGLGLLLNRLGRDRSDDSIDQVRDDLAQRLSALKRPLVVFVDDIDRLEPEQIRLVIRQIKANASLPNINFVLLFQPSIVEEALKPVAAGEGRDYLEKIVQASFDLPPVSDDTLLAIFLEQLDDRVSALALSENGFETTRWGNVLRGGIEPMLRNLRDSRRLLSSISIHVAMHEGEHAFEVNIIDFLALEALRVFEPEFHRAVGLEKRLLTQSSRFSGDGRQEHDKAAVKALLDIVDPAHRAACERLMRELFPTIEWALGGTHYSDGFWSTWDRAKRVCIASKFDRYFALQLSADVLSESEFAQFLAAATDRSNPQALDTIVASLVQRGRLVPLLDRLERSVEDLPLDRPELMLALMFSSGEALDRGGVMSMNGPFLTSWVTVCKYLRRLPTSQARREAFEQAFASTPLLAIPAQVLGLEKRAHDEPDKDNPPLLDIEDLIPLQQLWVAQMEEVAGDIARQLAQPNLIGRLYRWLDFGGQDAPRTWASSVAGDPEHIIPLLGAMVNRGSMHSINDLVATPTESFHKEHFDTFLPIETARAALSAVDRTALSADELKVVNLFERHSAAWDRKEERQNIEMLDDAD